MIVYTIAKNENDLEGILALQRANLPSNLTNNEILSQGFVTVVHSLSDIKKMNDIEPHVVAKLNDKVIAYLLAMTSASRDDIPILKPMFHLFNNISFDGKPISSSRYIVVGQVCVDKEFRGQGVLDNCYMTYRNTFQHAYDFAITEISVRNSRSINAHKRIGFREVHCYTAPGGETWSIVIWQWGTQ